MNTVARWSGTTASSGINLDTFVAVLENALVSVRFQLILFMKRY